METAAENNLKRPPFFLRWGVLFFISVAMFGNYYIYDSISPIADLLRDQLGFADSDIGWLQAIYSIPNVFMVLIGGIIIDRIGTRLSTFIFAALCLVGAVVTVLSADLLIMAVGRLIFGLGAESLIVAVTTVIGKWFKGKELSFAFGINLTIARLGTFAALNSPTWTTVIFGESFYQNWREPLLISVGAGVIAVVSVLIYWNLDIYAAKNFALRKAPKPDKVNFKEIFTFSHSYWVIVLLCVTFYSAIFPFQTFAIKLFQDVHGVARESAGFLTSLLILSSMILTPLFGLLSDYVGRRSLLMMFGSILLIPVYILIMSLSGSVVTFDFLLFQFKISNLVLPMAMMGLSFSLVPAVMWPSVAIIVKESKLGTAYGLMTMIQNIGLAGFNLVIGWANDSSNAGPGNPDGYWFGMMIFSILGFLGVIFSLLLFKVETGPNGHGLEKGLLHKKREEKAKMKSGEIEQSPMKELSAPEREEPPDDEEPKE